MSGLFGGPKQPNNVAPIIASVRLQTSAYGRVIPVVFGRARLSGNLLWYGDFTPVAHTTTQSSGGKGGGGGKMASTSYTYQAAAIIGLCEGPIIGVRNIWLGKEIHTATDLNLTLYTGSYSQTAAPYMSTNHSAQALGYRGTAYMFSPVYQLDGQAALPNHSFEVDGLFQYGGAVADTNPKDVLNSVLTDANFGMGFASSLIGDLTQYSNFCVASGIFISPAYTQQDTAHNVVDRLMQIGNSNTVWSEDKLKVVPYGDATVTGNSVTFTPILTPQYDLADDDFLDTGDPIRVMRTTQADAFNQSSIKFFNRANAYAEEPAEFKDQAAIEMYGLRPGNPITLDEITDLAVARTVVQLIGQRDLYQRNTYEFRIGWKYARLEPMDIVTLTDSTLGLSLTPVRLTEIEEDEDGGLAIKAEEVLSGVRSNAVYSSQAVGGYSADYNVAPGNINAPVLFEPPDAATTTGLEIWAAVSGGALWGGCQIWASMDNATFEQVGTIYGRARHGVLSSAFASGSDPDTANSCAVDLTTSAGQLIGGTKADADAFNTLAWVDGELIAFQAATLTAQYKYSLGTYIRRGIYGTTIKAHNAGTSFARLDQAIFKYPFGINLIGKPLYFKFVSFNVYGNGTQSIADVPVYTYGVLGSSLASPLPNVSNVATNFVANITQIYWTGVTDFRTVDYEIRIGATWATAKLLGRTPLTTAPAAGDGTYWVAAHYSAPGGLDVYSSAPQSIVIAGSTLSKNIIATYDEAATGWGGAVSGGALINNGVLQLMGAGNVLADANVLAESDMLWLGGVASSGYYTLPSGHTVNIGRVAPCGINISYTAQGQSIYDNVLTQPNILGMTDFLGAALGVKIGVQPQVSVAQADGIFGPWQNCMLGTYGAQYFKGRVLVTSSDPQVTALVSNVVFSVDMPDRIDKGTAVSVGSGGVTITYTAPFNIVPNVQITILNASAGDDVVLSGQTVNGFTVQILNGGVGVARSINWISQGY